MPKRGKRGGRRNAIKAIRRALKAHDTGETRGPGLAVAWTETPAPHKAPTENLRTTHRVEDIVEERASFLRHNDACNLIEEHHGPWRPTALQRSRQRVQVPGSKATVSRAAWQSNERYLSRCALVESDMVLVTRKRRGPATRHTAARAEVKSGQVHVKKASGRYGDF